MTVTLAPITADNWIECIRLAPTEEQQRRGYVASNELSLAQAFAERWWTPWAIYAGETMVGFLMHGRWPENLPAGHGPREAGIDYLIRIMIDRHHQGRGYGKAALSLLIERVAAEPESRAIELDYDRDNIQGARLYASLGFRTIHEAPDGEICARLDLGPSR